MKKVLIIDDERDFCHFVQANLQLIGNYEVITVGTGRKGIRAARKHNPDVILLDIMMPGLTGFETLKRLKKNKLTWAIPVIMLTAKDDDESQIKATGLYCENYLIKPVNAQVLKAEIEKVLARFGESAR